MNRRRSPAFLALLLTLLGASACRGSEDTSGATLADSPGTANATAAPEQAATPNGGAQSQPKPREGRDFSGDAVDAAIADLLLHLNERKTAATDLPTIIAMVEEALRPAVDQRVREGLAAYRNEMASALLRGETLTSREAAQVIKAATGGSERLYPLPDPSAGGGEAASLVAALARHAATQRINFQLLAADCGRNAECLRGLKALREQLSGCRDCSPVLANFNRKATAAQLRSGTLPTTFPQSREVMAANALLER